MSHVSTGEEDLAQVQSAEPQLWSRSAGALRETFWRAYRGENSGALILVMVVVIGIFEIDLRDTAYLSWDNFLGIVRQTAAITVMAVPTVFVISSGEIDLSFASVVPVAAFIAALALPHYGVAVAVLAALLFGVLVGAVNGLVTVGFRIPSFVVTLGTMGILIGLSERITNNESVSVFDQAFLRPFGAGTVGPVSVLLLWSLGVVAVGHVIMAWTPVGRALLATGANPNAARFSGIRTSRIKVGALIASGLGGALAGLLYIGQFAAASYTLGTSDLLTVIAAVIIGGTALSGGKGSVVGALVGSLLIGTLNNGLIIVGFANPEQLMARGVIIILAVIFSARTRTRGVGGLRFGPRRARREHSGGEAPGAPPPEQPLPQEGGR